MTPCIEWQGAKANGYGQRQVDGKVRYVHRIVWEEHHGPIPPGRSVMHICDNPPCINIDHLRLGTPKENTADMIEKGRGRNQKKIACPAGHPYDRAVTLHSGPRAGAMMRYCSTCKNERRRARYAEAKL